MIMIVLHNDNGEVKDNIIKMLSRNCLSSGNSELFVANDQKVLIWEYCMLVLSTLCRREVVQSQTKIIFVS